MFPNLLRPTRPTEVVRKDFIDLERTRVLEDHKTRRQASRQAFILGLAHVGAGVLFALIGFVLVILAGDERHSTVSLFGQSVETDSVGVACLVIGAVVVVVSLRSVLTVMDTRPRDDTTP